MSDSIFPSSGVLGSTGSGAFSSSAISSDLGGDFVALPGTSGSSSSGLDFGNESSGWGSSGSSIWDVLTDQSGLGSTTGNPTTADSGIGTSSGTSNMNTYDNPGGTQSNNPASPSGAGNGSNAILSTLEKYKYDIFAVVLGVVFVIIGAVQMAKSAGVPAIPA